MNSDTIKRMGDEEVAGLFNDEHLVMSAQCNHEVIDFLSEQIDKIEKAVIKEVNLKKPYKKLLTVPGIGEISRFRDVFRNPRDMFEYQP
ncbi:MAG: putative transposase [Candidatus Brocadiaceae bacterium]|nr:putative transposase [Candidatus Brocadiaceae bacterium]